MLSLGKLHKYFGMFVIFAVQFAICSGLLAKNATTNQDKTKANAIWLIVLNLLTLIVPITVCEILSRKFLKSEVQWEVKKKPNMSKQEFLRAINLG